MNHLVALTAAQGVLLYLALVWKSFQLIRAPRDVPLRMVTICLACAGAAYPFGVAAGHVALTQMSAGPMIYMWAQEVFLLGLVYALICFFLFSGLDSRRARTHARRQAAPLLTAVVVLTAVALVAPRGTSPETYPVSVVSMFFLTADLYVVYGLVVAFRWIRRYMKQAGPRLARGLALTSAGLIAMIMSTGLLVVAVVTRWGTGVVPSGLIKITTVLLVPGILLFITGMCYPGAAMRFAAIPVWLGHLRDYRRMRPLWSELHAAFPQDALSRVPLRPVRDAVSVRGVHRRYYRRAIECRDGLVRLSPHLADLDAAKEPTAIAAQLRRALRFGVPSTKPRQAVPVAIPTADGLDADVHELISLARALQTDAIPGER